MRYARKVSDAFHLFLHIGLFIFCICANSKADRKKDCPAFWFGPNCQYKCHCKGLCQMDGDCVEGCEQGWFGPQCQYEDTAQLASSSLPYLTDGNDLTCNSYSGYFAAVLSWKTPNPITWMRIVLSDSRHSELLRNLEIRFSPLTECVNKEITVTNLKTMDIHCDRAVVVYNITLRGDAVPFMCSVYVTGGRNLALHQLSVQSSLYSDSFCDESCSLPQNAVDGKTTSNLYSKSCTHTKVEDKPWWKVDFPRPYLINKYRLFNRYPYSSRLKLFNIVSWSSSRITFNYTDEGNNDSLNYTVIHSPTSLNIPVTSVVITSFNKAKILTICEFEAFGETICLNRTYGRDCENLCKCRNRTESCLVSTGGCMTGCDDGYIGGGCNTACEPTYFGNGCKQKCDERCLNQLCENIKGHCLECLPGRIGSLCEKSCPPFTYGPSCSKNCSLHCGGVGHCDPATGVCSSGCRDGYIGALCTEECDNSTYGSNCSLSCSPYCNMDVSISSDICHHFNGYCVHGCQPGYDGWQCNRACEPTYYGDDCKSKCSSQCLDQLCDNINGKCLKCPAEKFGDFCEQGDCLPPFYGFNCRELCSVNCFDQACNSTTGLCLDCLPGKIGDMCEEECQPSYYGQDCLQRCNIGCMDQLCNSTNGYCLKCPELKSGLYCELNSSEVTMHERLNLRCNLTNGQYFCVSEMEESNTKNCHRKNVAVIVLATFVGASLAGAIVVIIILWRKYHIGSKYFLCLFKLKSNDSTADQETFVFQQDCNDT